MSFGIGVYLNHFFYCTLFYKMVRNIIFKIHHYFAYEKILNQNYFFFEFSCQNISTQKFNILFWEEF